MLTVPGVVTRPTQCELVGFLLDSYSFCLLLVLFTKWCLLFVYDICITLGRRIATVILPW